MRSSSFSKATGLTHFRRVYVGASASSFHNPRRPALAVLEGPSCLFVGPIETASKEMLEALYRQARDSYYSGEPLILDDMFDKVELKLRLYGSKSVVKYPRCSLRRQSTYADAEEDRSLILALGSVWFMLFMLGASIFVLPTAYSFKLGLRDTFESIPLISNWRSPVESLRMANDMLFMGLGYLIGYPIVSASLQALEGVWRNDLVALKGCCPNCGEEVFAFVNTKEKSRDPHRAQCHVCQCSLEYRTKVQQGSGRCWVYGRVYLVRRT